VVTREDSLVDLACTVNTRNCFGLSGKAQFRRCPPCVLSKDVIAGREEGG
jgi:hypothetical protein